MLMEDSNKSPKETEQVKHRITEVALVKYHILVLHNQFFFHSQSNECSNFFKTQN